MTSLPANDETERSIWQERDFRLVWAGGLVNNIGDWLLMVALPVYVFTESGSGSATAAVFITELGISIIFGPWCGSLVDRWDLRSTLITTNLLHAITLLPLIAVTSERIWPVFIVVALQAILKQVNNPASIALVPRVVNGSQLVAANSANAAGSSLARLLGSPLGGVAVALGGLTTVVVVDAITFIAVAIAIVFVRAPTASLAHGSDGDTVRHSGVREGLEEVKRRPALLVLIAVQSLAELAFAMFPILFIVFVVEELHGGGTEVGVIRGMAAFGGIVASIFVARISGRVSAPKLMTWGYIGLGVVATLFVNAPLISTALWLYLILFALTGLPNVTSQIGATTMMQQSCPPQILGRLSGIISATGAVGAAIGAVTTGALIDHVEVRVLFNAQAFIFILCGVAAYTLTRRSSGDDATAIRDA